MTNLTNSLLPTPDALARLSGDHVYLQPATEADRAFMRPLARDERIWEFTRTLLIDENYDRQFDQYFDEALSLGMTGAGQAFIIHEKGRAGAGDRIIGMTRMYAIDWTQRRLEIGHTWYIPAVWGRVHNKECKLLLLQYLFEHLQFHRVEFRVAHQNLRSQRAVAKIGGVWEGELRKFMRRPDGIWRNSVIFSMLDDEWPVKKAALLELVGRLASL